VMLLFCHIEKAGGKVAVLRSKWRLSADKATLGQ